MVFTSVTLLLVKISANAPPARADKTARFPSDGLVGMEGHLV